MSLNVVEHEADWSMQQSNDERSEPTSHPEEQEKDVERATENGEGIRQGRDDSDSSLSREPEKPLPVQSIVDNEKEDSKDDEVNDDDSFASRITHELEEEQSRSLTPVTPLPSLDLQLNENDDGKEDRTTAPESSAIIGDNDDSLNSAQGASAPSDESTELTRKASDAPSPLNLGRNSNTSPNSLILRSPQENRAPTPSEHSSRYSSVSSMSDSSRKSPEVHEVPAETSPRRSSVASNSGSFRKSPEVQDVPAVTSFRRSSASSSPRSSRKSPEVQDIPAATSSRRSSASSSPRSSRKSPEVYEVPAETSPRRSSVASNSGSFRKSPEVQDVPALTSSRRSSASSSPRSSRKSSEVREISARISPRRSSGSSVSDSSRKSSVVQVNRVVTPPRHSPSFSLSDTSRKSSDVHAPSAARHASSSTSSLSSRKSSDIIIPSPRSGSRSSIASSRKSSVSLPIKSMSSPRRSSQSSQRSSHASTPRSRQLPPHSNASSPTKSPYSSIVLSPRHSESSASVRNAKSAPSSRSKEDTKGLYKFQFSADHLPTINREARPRPPRSLRDVAGMEHPDLTLGQRVYLYSTAHAYSMADTRKRLIVGSYLKLNDLVKYGVHDEEKHRKYAQWLFSKRKMPFETDPSCWRGSKLNRILSRPTHAPSSISPARSGRLHAGSETTTHRTPKKRSASRQS